MAELTPQVRRVYLMRKVYGMSHKEISATMGIARSTVEKHLTTGIMACERYVNKRTGSDSQVAKSTQVKTRATEVQGR